MQLALWARTRPERCSGALASLQPAESSRQMFERGMGRRTVELPLSLIRPLLHDIIPQCDRKKETEPGWRPLVGPLFPGWLARSPGQIAWVKRWV